MTRTRCFKTITSHVSSKRDIYGSNERRNILIRMTDDLLKENVIQHFENKMVISYNSYTSHLNKLSFIILIIYQSGITKKINSFPLLSITRLKNDCPNISSSEFISQSSIHVAHPSCSWIVTKPRCKIYRRSFIFPIGFSNVRQKRFRNEMRNFRRFNGR
ncbi:hypothetical protein HZU73_00802 [Apis mellifera caucasica]|uniref:Uncharacterized protein LOC102655229 n=1 Tax=Apis mellifera TaxID=7460 RepID=A0A7M7MU77_APIME|nr:uncharacterized protein LOC102655229 [Apis mellifera]KAG6804088.1 hypothetical protein HZU73_00802 [Apis mellifera caucasica]|eukprot:XP_026300935.1 uncharacterized protein LOC102655229 [Apis mellifera]